MPRKIEPPRLSSDPPSLQGTDLQRRYSEQDPLAVESVVGLSLIGRAIGAFFRSHYSKIGLTDVRFFVVMSIYRMERESGVATPSELASQAGSSRASMTQLLDGLEATKWIDRQPHPDDRRRIAIKLTRDATKRLAQFLPGHYRRLSKLVAHLTNGDRKQLLKIVDKLDVGLSELGAATADRHRFNSRF